MLPYKESLGEKVFRRWAWSMAITAMIAVSVAVLSIPAAAETDSAPEEPLLEMGPWIGDFDGMAERREIRALVVYVYSKTFYFLDQGRQRGASYELLKQFEKSINKKLKTKTLKFRGLSIPVGRDRLIPFKAGGSGKSHIARCQRQILWGCPECRGCF